MNTEEFCSWCVERPEDGPCEIHHPETEAMDFPRKAEFATAPTRGTVVQSAESSRMTGMRAVPGRKARIAAIRRFLSPLNTIYGSGMM